MLGYSSPPTALARTRPAPPPIDTLTTTRPECPDKPTLGGTDAYWRLLLDPNLHQDQVVDGDVGAAEQVGLPALV